VTFRVFKERESLKEEKKRRRSSSCSPAFTSGEHCEGTLTEDFTVDALEEQTKSGAKAFRTKFVEG